MSNTYIIELGGKQYLAKNNELITVPCINSEIDQIIEVKVISEIEEKTVNTEEQFIKAQVIAHKKSKKIYSFKKNRRKRYSRKKGHRDNLTILKIIGK